MPSAGKAVSGARCPVPGTLFTDVAAVLFDLDGTLIETRIDFDGMRREVLRLAEQVGVAAAPWAHLDVLAIVERVTAAAPDPAAMRAAAEAALTAIELDACPGAREVEGARELLHWLDAAGVRVGIVTRNCRRAVEQVLARIALPHAVLLTRDDVARVKPDPEHLWQAAAALGVPAARTLMVGDHRMDIRAGKAAGMRTVGLLTPERPPDYFAPEGPDLVLRDLRELAAWISP